MAVEGAEQGTDDQGAADAGCDGVAEEETEPSQQPVPAVDVALGEAEEGDEQIPADDPADGEVEGRQALRIARVERVHLLEAVTPCGRRVLGRQGVVDGVEHLPEEALVGDARHLGDDERVEVRSGTADHHGPGKGAVLDVGAGLVGGRHGDQGDGVGLVTDLLLEGGEHRVGGDDAERHVHRIGFVEGADVAPDEGHLHHEDEAQEQRRAIRPPRGHRGVGVDRAGVVSGLAHRPNGTLGR